ncbi:hypothetical protein BUALT_Bualt03G0092200 [Buddleja alternifolia]|uniref:Fe2OG dioxygenase domain-containing protein n=1 Tax=Buddleja alternifolia TaxID=168488 RepID=A0AAV6XZ28_9LAMI|nr:hypothetical protein BUALT_Bualt03G0092200 [Buddleja alternifolia]
MSMSSGLLKLTTECGSVNEPDPEAATAEKPKKAVMVDLGNGSQVLHMPRFISYKDSWQYFDYLDKNIPWTRPTIRVFAKSHVQPRDTCYVAREGLQQLAYNGYKPHAYSWDEFPPLKAILDLVHKALPESSFNSLLLNRYKGGNDHVGWHADDEKLYGPTPEIASVSFGCDRDFLLKKKPNKSVQGMGKVFTSGFLMFKATAITTVNGSYRKANTFVVLSFTVKSGRAIKGEPPSKRSKKNINSDQHAFMLKHGSLLVMSGYTQRDWLHSVPKRVKADSVRINLTFRRIL